MASGVKHFVYTSDQEGALRASTEQSIQKLDACGHLVQAVPENSPVGESQANGRAEQAVQQIENQLRTMKAAFEDRFDMRLPSGSIIMKWLVEHVAGTINRTLLDTDGRTPYQNLHGKTYNGHVLEFWRENHVLHPEAQPCKT